MGDAGTLGEVAHAPLSTQAPQANMASNKHPQWTQLFISYMLYN